MFDTEGDIKKIVEEGDTDKMNKLSEILEDVISIIEDCDEDLYKKYSMCIYKMAHGNIITEKIAKKIVANMQPYGEHWTLEQTTQVKNQYGFTDISDTNFYVVMNSAYNDYRDLFKDNTDMYAKWSYAFIIDIDAPKDKIINYYM